MKLFLTGAAAMLLILSLTLNVYQFGQLKTCVVLPDVIKPINLK